MNFLPYAKSWMWPGVKCCSDLAGKGFFSDVTNDSYGCEWELIADTLLLYCLVVYCQLSYQYSIQVYCIPSLCVICESLANL